MELFRGLMELFTLLMVISGAVQMACMGSEKLLLMGCFDGDLFLFYPSGVDQPVERGELCGGSVFGGVEFTDLLFREVFDGCIYDFTEGFSFFVVSVALVLHVILDGFQEVGAEESDFSGITVVHDPSQDSYKDFF